MLSFSRTQKENPPMGKEPLLPDLPPFDMEGIKAFALKGWELGRTHGLSHWKRVERNAILLSMEKEDGIYRLRNDVNIKVVRTFAYLHDKCRMGNGRDLEHGKRAAEKVLEMRNSLFKDFTDEEISLLEKACRFHTIQHKTGNATIDVCFDADRLDLRRVGITPRPNRMATPQGAFLATHTGKFEYLCHLMERHGLYQA